MIEGTVNGHREAVVEITILGLADQRERVTCVVDTGYDGALTLPAEVASSLGLPSMGSGRSMLGDGSWTNHRSYEAFVRLNGASRRVIVDEAETMPMLGMRLLEGHELRIDVVTGGRVSISRLPDFATG